MGSFINEELMRTALDGEDGEIKIDAKVPPTYANAINVHKKKEKDIEKELKDKKPELKKPFLGAKGKTTIMPKTQEMKKLHLSESLFDSPRSLGENYNLAPDIYAGIFRVIDNMEHIINYIGELGDEELCYSDMQQSYDVLEEAMMEFSDYLIELKAAENGKMSEAVAAPAKPEKKTRENRKADLFDRVYAELDGSQKGIESRYRIFNVPSSTRYHYEDVSVGYTPSLHIEVLADSEERLDFAKQVADAYELRCEIVTYTSKFATKPYAARVFIPEDMYESVRGKKLKESASSEDLRRRAMDAYKSRDNQFFCDLSDDELVTLQTSCQITDENPWGAAYDDEVFDAIAARPNSEELFHRATEITIRKMSLNQVVRIYRGITGLKNDNEFSEDELRDYVIKALRENCDSKTITETLHNALTEDYNYHSAIGKYFDYTIPQNVTEVFSDLVERTIENSADGHDLDEAIAEAIDEGLIYHKDIWAVKSFYEESELSDEAYEQLISDLHNIVGSLPNNEDGYTNESLKESAAGATSVLGDQSIIKNLYTQIKQELKQVSGVTIFPDKNPNYPYGMGNNYYWYRPESANTASATLGAHIKVCYGQIDSGDVPTESIPSDGAIEKILQECAVRVEELVMPTYNDAKIETNVYCGTIEFQVSRRGKVLDTPVSDSSVLTTLSKLTGNKFVRAYNNWAEEYYKGLPDGGDFPLFLNTPQNLTKLQNKYEEYLDDESWEESGFMDMYNPSDEFLYWSSFDGLCTSNKEDLIGYIRDELNLPQ